MDVNNTGGKNTEYFCLFTKKLHRASLTDWLTVIKSDEDVHGAQRRILNVGATLIFPTLRLP